MAGKSGTLYVVATPIGNLDDLSPRAREVLEQVSVIAAEDTRHSRKLLIRCHITASVVAYHDHNEPEQAKRLLRRLQRGDSVALISDAGTPLISDPGYRLVNAAHESGIRVTPIPGPNAAITALCAAGLPSDRFVFEGFLPAKAAARRDRLADLAKESRTLVFYESRHRIAASLADMVSVLGGERLAALARELTKRFETIRRDHLEGLAALVAEHPEQRKGEFVIVVEGIRPAGVEDREARELLEVLLEYLPTKKAAELAARLLNGKKNVLYQLALHLDKR